jgi:cytochrome b subunit of formate dehydrogenase
MASSASISQTSVDAFARTTKVVRNHHLPVRIGHWCALPLLLGLILSGISIYWSSPIFQHVTDPTTETSTMLQT